MTPIHTEEDNAVARRPFDWPDVIVMSGCTLAFITLCVLSAFNLI